MPWLAGKGSGEQQVSVIGLGTLAVALTTNSCSDWTLKQESHPAIAVSAFSAGESGSEDGGEEVWYHARRVRGRVSIPAAPGQQNPRSRHPPPHSPPKEGQR